MTKKERARICLAISRIMSDDAGAFEEGMKILCRVVGITPTMERVGELTPIDLRKFASGPNQRFAVTLDAAPGGKQ